MRTRANKRSAREQLGENVRARREEHGLSQEALAEQLGFHRTYISQLERSKLNVTLDTLERIASYFQVPLQALFDEHPARLGRD